MNERQEKEAFVGVRRVKIGENRLAPVRENQKTIKIGFPSRGKTRNHQKSAFPHGGKQEIIENQLSLTGKIKNHRKSTFPTLGKQEISKKRLSQHWEE